MIKISYKQLIHHALIHKVNKIGKINLKINFINKNQSPRVKFLKKVVFQAHFNHMYNFLIKILLWKKKIKRYNKLIKVKSKFLKSCNN
jgi:hypothetical protein